jgi:hypothetical protein
LTRTVGGKKANISMGERGKEKKGGNKKEKIQKKEPFKSKVNIYIYIY